jgi:hypothetical protein
LDLHRSGRLLPLDHKSGADHVGGRRKIE